MCGSPSLFRLSWIVVAAAAPLLGGCHWRDNAPNPAGLGSLKDAVHSEVGASDLAAQAKSAKQPPRTDKPTRTVYTPSAAKQLSKASVHSEVVKATPEKRSPAMPAANQGVDATARNHSIEEDCGPEPGNCAKLVRELLADAQHNWARNPPTNLDYETGVRIIAYRQLVSQLACSEMVQAVEESKVVAKAAGADAKSKADSAPVATLRVQLLSSELRRQLDVELKKRC